MGFSTHTILPKEIYVGTRATIWQWGYVQHWGPFPAVVKPNQWADRRYLKETPTGGLCGPTEVCLQEGGPSARKVKFFGAHPIQKANFK